MARISKPITEIKSHYTVVVVGSGYGGAIAASRLSRAGQDVCLLERGREFRPGEYPNTLPQASGEMQVDGPEGHVGSRTGLYDFRVNPDINVFLGCGLGGTSLVNANVSLRAESRVFDDERWPAELRADRETRLEAGYHRAEEMLKPVEYPDGQPRLPKVEAQRISADAMGEPFKLTPINVNYDYSGANHVGEEQQPCNHCGDCVTGCNHGAKNTVLMNYLPDARNFGAEIFTQVAVRRVERRDQRWFVHYQVLESGREKFDAPTLTVSADVVVLAAGTLGSTEIMLRSREAGLSCSNMLGKRFTGNGDVLGFGFNTEHEIRGVGFGHRDPEKTEPSGACITSVIDARAKPELEHGMVIEEGVIPGALAAIVPGSLELMASAVGKDTAHGIVHALKEKARELESMVAGARHGAARNTQTYLIMTHDDSAGELALENDRLRVRWPGVGDQPIFERANENLRRATEALGGTFIKNPTWTKLLKHNIVTVHPLGCCVMAEDASSGVVNHKGQVFAGTEGDGVHEGLYIADGAVIPRSLGVNPLLTISAVAERTMELLAEDRGWQIDYALPSAPPERVAEPKLGVQFTETMRGFFSTEVKDDYTRGAEQGRAANSGFEFTLTIISNDLESMLDPHSEHAARMIGTATAPALSAAPLTVTDGTFNLFVDDPDRVDTRLMRYRMKLSSEEGRQYHFEGFKVVHHDATLDEWPDTSTLYITVGEGDAESPVMGKGILHIEPADFLKQMTTMKAVNAKSTAERLEALAKFGRYFAGSLFHLYGGIIERANPLKPDAKPRVKRPLRLPAPEVYHFKTADGVSLRLTRFNGGGKGPVIMAPGFGTSGTAYLIDTVETNFPEYLYAHGYDSFVFDYRASPELPSAHDQFTVDEVAKLDWPAAVAKVSEITGEDSVQIVGHCVGSLSFLLALMSGLEGVRGGVSSQLTPYPVAPALTNVKANLHLGELIMGLGVKTMSTDFDFHSFGEQAFDKFMLLYPSKEQCNSPVCRRILFMYGEVYKHDQLNEATHDAMHEMFGVANFTLLRQVTAMIRAGHAIDKDGNDSYRPNVERLKIPITFIHGADNNMFLPEGSKKCYEWLCESNGGEWYRREVIPGYGHMDCFIGKDAARDVFPIILKALDEGN